MDTKRQKLMKKMKTSTLARQHELRVSRILAKDHLFDLFCSVQVRGSMSKKQRKTQKTNVMRKEG